MNPITLRLFLPILLLPLSQFSTADSPIDTPIVTTSVESRFGGVGAVIGDDMGYIYISDFLEGIWRLNPDSQQVSNHATGFYGASGTAFDKNGNLYQANFFGNSISRIDRNGSISSYATDGLSGPVGMVFDDDGDLLVCNCGDQSVKKITASGVVSTFATSSLFSCPNGIASDGHGNFLVVSFSGSKIVKISPEGDTSLFADTGGNGVGHIVALRGVYYATSYHDNVIYKITNDGEVSIFAGTGDRAEKDGTALEAAFSNPNGIAADATETYLFVNDNIGMKSAIGLSAKRFSVRRIELPRLDRILAYAIDNGSSSDAEDTYWRFVKDPSHEGETTEAEINSLAWTYLLSNRYEEAILAFRLNTQTYSNSWTAFNGLGAAYLRSNQKASAVKALERAVELNPENQRAIERLRRLQSDGQSSE